MSEFLTTAAAAAGLGFMTTVHPCPLAMNVAGMTFIARHVGRPGRAVLAGSLYILGQSAVYVGLGAAIAGGLVAASAISAPLQQIMGKLIGPVLIMAGMFLLGLISLRGPRAIVGERMRERAAASPVWWSLALGALFALSFCPISAYWFFLAMVPLALREQSVVLVPLAYAVGAAAPVAVLAVLTATGGTYAAKVFNRLRQVELWARRVAGVLFILVGAYFVLVSVGLFSR